MLISKTNIRNAIDTRNTTTEYSISDTPLVTVDTTIQVLRSSSPNESTEGAPDTEIHHSCSSTEIVQQTPNHESVNGEWIHDNRELITSHSDDITIQVLNSSSPHSVSAVSVDIEVDKTSELCHHVPESPDRESPKSPSNTNSTEVMNSDENGIANQVLETDASATE